MKKPLPGLIKVICSMLRFAFWKEMRKEGKQAGEPGVKPSNEGRDPTNSAKRITIKMSIQGGGNWKILIDEGSGREGAIMTSILPSQIKIQPV